MNDSANFYIEILLSASLPVKLVMLILILASVWSWLIIFSKSKVLNRAQKEAKKFEETFWSGVDLNRLYDQLVGEKNEGLARVFVSGFKEFQRIKKSDHQMTRTIDGSDRAMRVALGREIDRMESALPTLATIGSTSPYIGLFGTVIGIMLSFHALSDVTQATIALVAPGISEALIATAMGLFAAIPAVIFYNKFSDKVERIYAQYDAFKEEFSTILHRQLG
ncbi:protein TolQ [Marinicella sp. W31]|uniref:protein TolQ n=1 Tax=Marinicella sp. W31 TaxID=3023713 RepID=UPI0037576DB1